MAMDKKHSLAFLDVLLKHAGHAKVAAILDDFETIPLPKELRDLVEGLSEAYRKEDYLFADKNAPRN